MQVALAQAQQEVRMRILGRCGEAMGGAKNSEVS